MAFEIAPQPGDRGEPDVKLGRVGGGAIGEERRLIQEGIEVLAWGALVCPACSLPISPAPRVAPRTEIACGFCDHSAPALAFLREEIVDTPGNDVALVARVT